MKRFFLNILVGFLTKGRVTPDKFDSIVQWCIAVEDRNIPGGEKHELVHKLTIAIVPTLGTFIVNMVIELALSWAVRTGQITTKSIETVSA